MKVGIYTDVHASYTSSIMPIHGNGKYSMRLQMIVDSFKWMYELFDKHNVEQIFNLGDLFDSHTVSSPEITAISEAYSFSRGVPEIHITGNHEMLDSSHNFYSTSILDNFSFIDVYNSPQRMELDGFKFAIIPHMRAEEITHEMLKNLKSEVLFSHIDIKGSHLRPDYIMESGVDAEKLSMYFDYVFNGHLHTAETLNTSTGTVMNAGSMSSMSFSDSNSYIPSVLIFDTDTKKIERFNNPYAILFRKISATSLDELMSKLNKFDKQYRYIFRVTIPYSIKDDAKSVLKEYGNVVAYRVVTDIRTSSVISTSAVKNVKSLADRSVDEDFIEFLDDNQNLLKYPISMYQNVLKEISV